LEQCFNSDPNTVLIPKDDDVGIINKECRLEMVYFDMGWEINSWNFPNNSGKPRFVRITFFFFF